MSSLPYRYIIGLEIHVELATRTKMFCRCLNDPFGASPNQYTCPICLGLPGTLPVPNKEAVKRTILVGKALGSTTPALSKWDRKHYFYPDLPKGYQISQYDMPLCEGGEVSLLDKEGNIASKIRFERVHLEEDAGKLLHSASGGSLVDLNRAGVPLMEMVSKPDLTSPEQARQFLQELRLLMRVLGVSDADMEKGQMRCDVNVNIAFEFEGKEVKTPITEVKNVNSTRAVERSLVVEAKRQYEEWMAGGAIRTRVNKLTAGWDEDSGSVQINRAKEAANDYRYFPEPDIPPLTISDLPDLQPGNMQLPELPNAIRARYLSQGVNLADLDIFLADLPRFLELESLIEKTGVAPKELVKWAINLPESLQLIRLAELVDIVQNGEASFSAIKESIKNIKEKEQGEPEKPIRAHLEALDLLQVHDEAVVQLAIEEVIKEQAQAVTDYLAGKEHIFGFLVGQVMKKTKGKAQPAKVQEAVRQHLTR